LDSEWFVEKLIAPPITLPEFLIADQIPNQCVERG
jgi:hypothetical protein